jgi:hypothetical protein
MFRRHFRWYLLELARLLQTSRDMAEVYFHYSNPEGMFVDQGRVAVRGLADVRERATVFMRSLIMAPNSEDWRGWILHVNDDLGDEILTVPFTSMLGKPH